MVCVWFEVCGLWCVVWCGGVVGGCVCVCGDFELCLWLIVLGGKDSQVECVAGAAHLPNDFGGVPR